MPVDIGTHLLHTRSTTGAEPTYDFADTPRTAYSAINVRALGWPSIET